MLYHVIDISFEFWYGLSVENIFTFVSKSVGKLLRNEASLTAILIVGQGSLQRKYFFLWFSHIK